MKSRSVNDLLEEVHHPLLAQKKVRLLISREDLQHPQISGNKWYKLKHNIAQAKASGVRRLVSFGGAYSNHLHALAYAGQLNDMETVGLVRGELIEPLNATLSDAVQWGMKLIAVSRAEYRSRHDASAMQRFAAPFMPCMVIPEGGANCLAVRGCSKIAQNIETQMEDVDYLCVPCGTGATLAGLVSGLTNSNTQVLGFSALKGLLDIEEKVAKLLCSVNAGMDISWQINHQYHCGGFARVSPELVSFLDEWQAFSDIPLEPIYTGKMLFGLFQLIEADYFPGGSNIVAIHTGGLQGRRGMEHKMARMREPARTAR